MEPELQFSQHVKFQRLTVWISEIYCSLVLFACQEIREYCLQLQAFSVGGMQVKKLVR